MSFCREQASKYFQFCFRKLLIGLHDPYILMLMAIYIVGLAFRVYGLSSASLWEDEAHSALMVQGIIKFGIPKLPSGHVPVLEPPLYPYIMAVFWSLFGEDIVLARAVGALVSSFMILVTHKVTSEVWNKEAGVIASFFVAFDPIGVALGRQFRSYSFAGLSALLLTWIAIKAMKKQLRGWKLLLVGFAGSLFSIASSYLLTLAFVSLLLSFMLICVLEPVIVGTHAVLKDRNKALSLSITIEDVREIIKAIVIVAFMLLLLILGASFSGHILSIIGKMSNEFFRILPKTEVTFHPDFVNFLLYVYGPLIGIGIFGLITLLVLKPRFGLLLSTLFFFPFFVLSTLYVSYTVTVVYTRYIYPFTAFIHIFAGIALVSFPKFLSLLITNSRHAKLKKYHKAIYVSVIVALLVSHAFVRLSEAGLLLRIFDPKVMSDVGQPDFLSAANKVKSQMLPTDIIISTLPVATYYTLKHTEYWLMSDKRDIEEIGREVNGKIVNYMVGAELISDLQEFIEVILKHDSGWIIIPYYHLNPEIIDPGILTMINTLFSHDVTPDGTLHIYHWNQSLSDM